MFSAAEAARFLDEAHRTRARYQNLPEAIAPQIGGRSLRRAGGAVRAVGAAAGAGGGAARSPPPPR